MFRVNLKNKAIVQTTEPFNSMCNFSGHSLGATEDGIFRICGYSDNGVAIPAVVRTGKVDLGTEREKRMAYVYLGVETNGQLELEVFCDDVSIGTFDVDVPGTGRQEALVKLPKGASARYWAFELRNVDGAFFVLYSMKLLPVVLQSAV